MWIVASKGEKLELDTAFEELRAALVDACDDIDFDETLDKLKQLRPLSEEQSKELLKEIDEDVIEELKEETIEKHNEGWAAIKIMSMRQAGKLEEFVTRELWPHFNEKDNYRI